MAEIEFPYHTQNTPDGEVFIVQGPDMLREKMIPLHSEGAEQIRSRLGAKPSRSSMVRWRIDGYPIDRQGPRVRLPCVIRLKKVYTSTPALTRWLTMVQVLAEEVQACGSVQKWTEIRQAQARSDRNG